VADLAPEKAGFPTGYAKLDQALPGGGWPPGSLIEVLQQRPQQHVWQLLLPVLAPSAAHANGPIVLVGAPCQPFVPGLSAQGLSPHRLLCVQAEKPSALLWAAEQALRCAEVTAVMAWLPQARAEELRRLHMAAQQQDRLLFVFRSWKARHEASPASLRILVDGLDSLTLHIVKRRGPPLMSPVQLQAHPARLAALLQARKARAAARPGQAATDSKPGRSHVLDRTASLA
jgi:protein ImuA